ncbi:TPA: hypothetical protein MIP25_27165, partial [Klebsiella pneumoniae]|nr:hypothetical protein [Klebsiella pneumoniae]
KCSERLVSVEIVLLDTKVSGEKNVQDDSSVTELLRKMEYLMLYSCQQRHEITSRLKKTVAKAQIKPSFVLGEVPHAF